MAGSDTRLRWLQDGVNPDALYVNIDDIIPALQAGLETSGLAPEAVEIAARWLRTRVTALHDFATIVLLDVREFDRSVRDFRTPESGG